MRNAHLCPLLVLLLGACASPNTAPAKTVTIDGTAPPATTFTQGGETPTEGKQPSARELSTQRHSVAALVAAVKASRARFRERAAKQPSYAFSATSGSFTGALWTYRLTVDSEKVMSRSLESRDPDGAISESWTEDAPDVGTHDGGPTAGIDALHAYCLARVLTKPTADNDLFVTIGEDGLMRTCVYVPKGCMDDCSSGVEGLSEIAWDEGGISLTRP